MSAFDLRPGTCGCCEPPSPATPLIVHNRPALDEVAYRIGTYASFRQAMLQLVPPMAAQLVVEVGLAAPPLQRWTSRDSDDYGIAVIEMWATIADILTFYSERYANEAWLRTAVSRGSLRRLAALLGYRLNPGVAASTHLSFTLDDDTTLELPAGLLTQSIPKDGETPQKFETSAALSARSSLNAVRAYGEPEFVDGLSAGNRRETLEPGSFVPIAGDEVILFTDNAAPVEERTIEAATEVDGRPMIRWSRALRADHGEAYVRGRSFRLFGHNAPAGQLVAVPQGTTPAQFVAWEQTTTNFSVSGTELDLDGTVDGIEAGATVVVVAGSTAHERTVDAVEQVSASIQATTSTGTVDVLTGSATRLTLSGSSLALDRRTTVVVELAERLEPLDWRTPHDPIGAGTKSLYLPYREVGSLEKGRLLVLDDEAHDPMLVELAEDAAAYEISGVAEFLEIELKQGTARHLDHATATLYGNIAHATHGETVAEEILGDGDASETLQEFSLAKSPVTHTADPTARGGAASSVQVYVDRVAWTRRDGLYGAGRRDRVYTLSIDDDHETSVRFGDGIFGARLPTGRANVVATYRRGLGVAGNVDAGQIATALHRPTGLDGVVNPLPAAGGVEPESRDDARRNAPNTVRTFDRAVSLRDFADLAREFAGIEKSFATWVWDGEERAVHVTVGGEDGNALSSTQLGDLRVYLDERRDPTRSLRIAEYVPVPFRVQVTVDVATDRFTEDVHAAAVAALRDAFAYDNRDFGQAVHLSDVYAIVQGVAGVSSALVTVLRYKRSSDTTAHGVPWGPVLVHAPIFGAQHRAGTIVAAELAVVETDADVTVTANGGIPS